MVLTSNNSIKNAMIKLMFALAFLGMTFSDYSEDDAVAQEEQNKDISEVRFSFESDKAASVLAAIISDAYEGHEISNSKRNTEVQIPNGLSYCVMVKVGE
jgi:hypothetical protein